MKLGKYSLTPTENKLYTLDYSQWLADSEILQSVTFVVTPADTPAFAITNGAIAMDGKSLSYHAGGGVDGHTYEIIVQITTSLTQVKDDSVYYAVKNI